MEKKGEKSSKNVGDDTIEPEEVIGINDDTS